MAIDSLVLNVLLTYVVATTCLYLITKGREIHVGRHRLRFIVGGFLVFLGRARKPSGKGVNKVMKGLFIASLFVCIALFYVQLLPIMLKTVVSFVTSPKNAQPSVVPIPILFTMPQIVPYLLVSIGIAALVHELAHAWVALREGIPVRSWGLGVLALVPFAFVELDDKAFEESSLSSKLGTLCAGVFANIATALVALLLFFVLQGMVSNLVPTPVVQSVCCDFCSVNCTALTLGLKPGTYITAIDGVPIRDLDDLRRALSMHSCGDSVTFTLCREGRCWNATAVLGCDRNGKPCIGIYVGLSLVKRVGLRVLPLSFWDTMLIHLRTLLYFVFAVNYSVALINAVPLFITDGSKTLTALLSYVRKGEALKFIRVADVLNLIVLVLALAISSYIILAR